MGIPILTAEINRHLAQAAKTVEASSEICCAKDRPPSAHAKQITYMLRIDDVSPSPFVVDISRPTIPLLFRRLDRSHDFL